MLGTHAFPKHFLDCTMKRKFVTLFLFFLPPKISLEIALC